ncbi:unnamed protein product [Phyllotreta striolata]|uniref:THIF-type NAD/FAD binding fold domain-containing protein n=1 Tax=Phyllotreta striolata TaxID=444603 RepID=A0A9P0DXA8_PHYSR|nr:unnamed protein product [Phyllotreta striolata]
MSQSKEYFSYFKNFDVVEKTRCLILGAGTLGCSVARSLLPWGIQHITFVDKDVVSPSNPTRQSLYTDQDWREEKPKAEAAADNIKIIFPEVNIVGHRLKIPSIGHSVEKETIERTVKELSGLIENHDIIFLLTDTRGSRWLPTVLGQCMQKIVINVSIDLDSYTVSRHGVYTEADPVPNTILNNETGLTSIDGRNLACFFCTENLFPEKPVLQEIIKPLDKKYTVTRPGVPLIAATMAVELAISLLIQTSNVSTPAFFYANSDNNKENLKYLNYNQMGLVPHVIKGNMSTYGQLVTAFEKNAKCAACSDTVVKQYQQQGNAFFIKVLENPRHLKKLLKMEEGFDRESILNDVRCKFHLIFIRINYILN